jgi:DNA-binding CsgD family transcriptional regulator
VDRHAALRLGARGLTLAEIGWRFGISKQGVHQLLRKAEADNG